jgi:hypothetical protein
MSASEKQCQLLIEMGYDQDPTKLSSGEASAEIEYMLRQKRLARELEKKTRAIIKEEFAKLYAKLLKDMKELLSKD